MKEGGGGKMYLGKVASEKKGKSEPISMSNENLLSSHLFRHRYLA